MSGLTPFFFKYYADMSSSENEHDWRQTLVRLDKPFHEITAIEELLQNKETGIYLKDARSDTTVLFAGELAKLEKLIEQIRQEGALSESTAIDNRSINAAHTPELYKPEYIEILQDIEFQPPRIPLLSQTGTWLNSDCGESDAIRRFVFENIVGPLGTQAACREAEAISDTVLVIGSAKSLKALEGIECPSLSISPLTTSSMRG